MHGTFVWNELATGDVERAKEFYAQTLGWTIESFDIPDGPYFVAKLGDRYVAGIGGPEQAAVPGSMPHWFSFVEVDDVDARVATAVKLGAQIIRPAEDVPRVGRVAIIRDPTGAALGLMTSAK